MEMEKAVPFVGMVIVQLAQAGATIAAKVAMANGMTTFSFISYSNIMASFLLLPICFSLHRSSPPPLLPSFLCGFFLLGFIGFMVQLLGITGLLFASASLSTTILNLIPGFTFVFAVILRMEKFNCRSSTTMAKIIGTLVTILGAIIATLYQGPALLGAPDSNSNSLLLSSISSDSLIGGLLITLDSLIAAVFIIAQALVMRRCPSELILMLFYSLFVAIVTALVSLAVENDLSAWSLNSAQRLIPVIYSGLFGNVFQVSIIMWCVRRKGPVFGSIFHPFGVIFSIVAGVVVLGETFYLGSLVGAVVVVVGFYAVLWGKAKEAKTIEAEGSNGKTTPLLQDHSQLA